MPNIARKRTHIHEWRCWDAMKTRCLNPNHKDYHRYGGRGIRICDRWIQSFADFVRDVGERPSLLHTLDRIDNDGHYVPGNVRWSTRVVQSQNTANTRLLTHDGVTLSVSEWARRIGITVESLRDRLKNHSVDVALQAPASKRGHRISN